VGAGCPVIWSISLSNCAAQCDTVGTRAAPCFGSSFASEPFDAEPQDRRGQQCHFTPRTNGVLLSYYLFGLPLSPSDPTLTLCSIQRRRQRGTRVTCSASHARSRALTTMLCFYVTQAYKKLPAHHRHHSTPPLALSTFSKWSHHSSHAWFGDKFLHFAGRTSLKQYMILRCCSNFFYTRVTWHNIFLLPTGRVDN
jgi:hypothetical protein